MPVGFSGIMAISWVAFSIFVITYSIVFQTHMLAIFFFSSSYVWYLIASRIDSPQAYPNRHELVTSILRVVFMCILVIVCLWISGETERDDSFFWDDFFFFSGPIIGGFLAGITSKTHHTALLSCLAMSVMVSLLTSVFWAEDIGEFRFGFIYLMLFSIIGLIPSRIIVMKNHLKRTVKYRWLVLLPVIVVSCLVSAFLVMNRPPKIVIVIHPEPPIQVKPGYYIDFDVLLENHGGKGKNVAANVTFPDGFITHKHRDAVQGILQFYYGTIIGGQGSRIGKDVIAPNKPGNYTGNVIVWGTNIHRQTKNFTVLVGT